MKNEMTRGEKMVTQESAKKCQRNLELAVDLIKNRKYRSASDKLRIARSYFASVPFEIKHQYEVLEKNLYALNEQLKDKDEDEPSFFPREISLEEALAGIKSSKLRMIGRPILEVVRDKSRIPFCLGHRIDKNPYLAGASLFLIGEDLFSNETEEHRRGNCTFYRESHTFAIQLYGESSSKE